MTGEQNRVGRLRGDGGFTIIELLIGLTLTLLIACVALSVWRGLEQAGTDAGDRMVRLIQGRVAMARLSRDLRLGTAQGCPFPAAGAILSAQPNQVVFLTRIDTSGDLALVEWELTGGTLMRRKGNCPPVCPSVFSHTLYNDHKTMLEDVARGGCLRYFAGGAELVSPVPADELASVDEIRLDAEAGASDSRMLVGVKGDLPVGRWR